MVTLAQLYRDLSGIRHRKRLSGTQARGELVYFCGARALVDLVTTPGRSVILRDNFKRVTQEILNAAERASRRGPVEAPGDLPAAFDKMMTSLGKMPTSGAERDVFLTIFYAGATDAVDSILADDRVTVDDVRAVKVFNEIDLYLDPLLKRSAAT